MLALSNPAVIPADPAAPAATTHLSLSLGDTVLTLTFSPDLIERSTHPNSMDLWAVTVCAAHVGALPAVFLRTSLTAPLPSLLLARMASDLSIALAMPKDANKAIDWLFSEGYATWPSDAVKLQTDLASVMVEATALLSGSGIEVSHFTTHLLTLPAVPASRRLERRSA